MKSSLLAFTFAAVVAAACSHAEQQKAADSAQSQPPPAQPASPPPPAPVTTPPPAETAPSPAELQKSAAATRPAPSPTKTAPSSTTTAAPHAAEPTPAATAPVAPPKPVEPPPPPPPVVKEFTIPAGTSLAVTVLSNLGSETSQVEDIVKGSLAKPIVIDGTIVAPQGADVRGVVSDAKKSGRVKGKASLGIAFDRLTVRGETHQIQTAPVVLEAQD
jgi:hypothetical protein